MENGNELAFPMDAADGYPANYGLTKRELFAAMAMQGLCSAKDTWTHRPRDLASEAVKRADTLISELGDGY